MDPQVLDSFFPGQLGSNVPKGLWIFLRTFHLNLQVSMVKEEG